MSNQPSEREQLQERLRQLDEEEARSRRNQRGEKRAGLTLSQNCLTQNHTACSGDDDEQVCICFCHKGASASEPSATSKEAGRG